MAEHSLGAVLRAAAWEQQPGPPDQTSAAAASRSRCGATTGVGSRGSGLSALVSARRRGDFAAPGALGSAERSKRNETRTRATRWRRKSRSPAVRGRPQLPRAPWRPRGRRAPASGLSGAAESLKTRVRAPVPCGAALASVTISDAFDPFSLHQNLVLYPVPKTEGGRPAAVPVALLSAAPLQAPFRTRGGGRRVRRVGPPLTAGGDVCLTWPLSSFESAASQWATTPRRLRCDAAGTRTKTDRDALSPQRVSEDGAHSRQPPCPGCVLGVSQISRQEVRVSVCEARRSRGGIVRLSCAWPRGDRTVLTH